jgi:hypothetical protein
MSVNGTHVEDKCVDQRVNVNILASTCVPFTLTMVQVPNIALTHTRRTTVYLRRNGLQCTKQTSHLTEDFVWKYKSATLFFKCCPVLPASFLYGLSRCYLRLTRKRNVNSYYLVKNVEQPTLCFSIDQTPKSQFLETGLYCTPCFSVPYSGMRFSTSVFFTYYRRCNCYR